MAETFLDHFHGSVFAGLLRGAIEVYVRSRGWRGADDAPRPLPLPVSMLLGGLLAPEYVAVVPLPFPPPALPGFLSTMTLSDSRPDRRPRRR